MSLLNKGFYFARHGQTDFNVENLVTGTLDIELNDEGIRQAKRSRSVTNALPILSCFCSPLKRALDTAKIMVGDKCNISIVENLEERRWGKLAGVHKSELDRYDFNEMQVESWQDYVKRTVEALSNIESEGSAFVVAHSGTFRVLCDYLKIRIEKKPVRNAWPYYFYTENNSWHVVEVPEPK